MAHDSATAVKAVTDAIAASTQITANLTTLRDAVSDARPQGADTKTRDLALKTWNAAHALLISLKPTINGLYKHASAADLAANVVEDRAEKKELSTKKREGKKTREGEPQMTPAASDEDV